MSVNNPTQNEINFINWWGDNSKRVFAKLNSVCALPRTVACLAQECSSGIADLYLDITNTHAVAYECGDNHACPAEFIIARQIECDWSGWTGDFLRVLTAYLNNTATDDTAPLEMVETCKLIMDELAQFEPSTEPVKLIDTFDISELHFEATSSRWSGRILCDLTNAEQDIYVVSFYAPNADDPTFHFEANGLVDALRIAQSDPELYEDRDWQEQVDDLRMF